MTYRLARELEAAATLAGQVQATPQVRVEADPFALNGEVMFVLDYRGIQYHVVVTETVEEDGRPSIGSTVV